MGGWVCWDQGMCGLGGNDLFGRLERKGVSLEASSKGSSGTILGTSEGVMVATVTPPVRLEILGNLAAHQS